MSNISNTPNGLYTDALPQWELVEDACAGQSAVKKGREKYLPKPNPSDTSAENNTRYDQYLARANYYNTCFRTLMGMIGVAFRKSPKKILPTAIDYINQNADGAGLTIEQQAQWTLSEVIKKGRCGLLVDYPATAGDTSMVDVQRGIRATIKAYAPESILDWNEEKTETGSRLNFVKLAEETSVLDLATGDREDVTEFLVLRLIEGVYSVQRYDDGGEPIGDELFPRNAGGALFDHIPFVFAGSENNNPDIDQALLYDLAVVNIGHYRNSADNEEASFIAGQPTMAVTSSLSATVWQEQNPNGVQIGARKGHFLGESGALSLVQASPNNLPRELMKDKEAQMVGLGAQLVSPSSNETAFTTGVNLATNTSALSLAIGNVSAAYAQCLEWANEFMSSSNDEIEFSINTDFFPANIDAATITAWVAGIQGGILPASALYAQLRDANLTALTDEEIEEETEGSGAGLDLA